MNEKRKYRYPRSQLIERNFLTDALRQQDYNTALAVVRDKIAYVDEDLEQALVPEMDTSLLELFREELKIVESTLLKLLRSDKNERDITAFENALTATGVSEGQDGEPPLVLASMGAAVPEDVDTFQEYLEVAKEKFKEKDKQEN